MNDIRKQFLQWMYEKAEEALASDSKTAVEEAESIMSYLDELGFHEDANEVGHLIEKACEPDEAREDGYRQNYGQ